MRTLKKLLCLVALASAGVALAACNTTEGFGKDIEAGGRKLKNSAADHNN